jgi:hypothetical protein
MTRRYTYSTCLNWGGDEPTAELDVEVSFSVAWGSPESGRFGSPEHYDPGSGDVVEDIRVHTVEGLERPWHLHPGGDDALAAEIIAKLEMVHEAEMLAEAREEEAAAYDDAMERRAEGAREDRWS